MKDLFLNLKNILPGFFLILFVSILSNFLSSYIIIGTVATAIILGIFINNVFSINHQFNPGITFCEKHILSLAIILMGAHLNFSILSTLSYQIIIIIIALIIIAIVSSYVLGKIFKISTSLSVLLGVGNGICGSSAIAGASSVINAKNEDVALSVSVINLLGAIGIFLVPSLIDLMSISSEFDQSVIIGSTIQAVGQVTAAGYIMGDEVGRLATFIKMVRILALGPMLICLSIIFTSKSDKSTIKKIFSIPSFIIGFIIVSIITNMNIIPSWIILYVNDLSKYLLILAMVAIGINVSLSSLADKGLKVIFVSSVTFLIQLFFCIHFVT